MTDGAVALLFADLALILVLARLIGRVARRVGLPAVVGELVAGILLGPTLFGGALTRTLFPVDVRPFLGALANLGLLLFMFVVGLGFDYARVRGRRRAVGATAVGASVVPFALGVPLALVLLHTHHTPNRTAFVLFMGVALAVTAFPVLARVIAERGMSAGTIGTVALSAAAICDVAAWCALALVQVIVGDDGTSPHWTVLLLIPYVVGMFFVVRPLLARVLGAERAWVGSTSLGRLAVVLVGLLLSAGITQFAGLHFVFGAFVFGMVMPRRGFADLHADVLRHTELGTTLLLPVYFVVSGCSVDLSRIGTAGAVEFALILLIAVAGKFLGTFAGARSFGMTGHQASTLAVLMNTRGLTEIVVLTVGLRAGILDQRLFSLLVLMAVVTTAMAAPLLRWLERRDPVELHTPVSRT